jgi:hypothetical protein
MYLTRTTSDELADLVELERRRWPAMLDELARQGVPVAVDGDGDGGSGDAGDGGDGDSGDAGDGDSGSGSGDGAGDGGGDVVTMSKADHDALQEAVAQANAAKRAAEKRAASKETAGKKEAGKFEELYNESEAKVGKITSGVSRMAVNAEIAAVAGRLGYRNPAIAAQLIDTNGLDAEVELDGDEPKISVSNATKTMIERRLTERATQDRYLVDESRARQLQDAGGGDSGRNSQGGGGGNADMNAAIRRAAGRA